MSTLVRTWEVQDAAVLQDCPCITVKRLCYIITALFGIIAIWIIGTLFFIGAVSRKTSVVDELMLEDIDRIFSSLGEAYHPDNPKKAVDIADRLSRLENLAQAVLEDMKQEYYKQQQATNAPYEVYTRDVEYEINMMHDDDTTTAVSSGDGGLRPEDAEDLLVAAGAVAFAGVILGEKK